MSMESVASRIYLIRGQKVMLDSDLAEMYMVKTSALNQAVSRNRERFPQDFAFQLTETEWEFLKSQIVISNTGRGGRRKLPWVFTEYGSLMLSSVLRSERSAQVNIAIVRTFVRMREVLATHKDVARKIEEHDHHIGVLYDQLDRLLHPPQSPKRKIGYIWHED
ncbi:MAG: DNA-binding protein [Candidatus Entotheonella factor]|uniref:DNA-binding protein n=1 Tax=Entotheonella factor TaxID=1429438 RepID=W4LFU1_ENTF1|nr:MAG: DNA-binding protein [Candidatus Entotheonella factor]